MARLFAHRSCEEMLCPPSELFDQFSISLEYLRTFTITNFRVFQNRYSSRRCGGKNEFTVWEAEGTNPDPGLPQQIAGVGVQRLRTATDS